MILVLGNGQVASSFYKKYRSFCFDLTPKIELDLTNYNALKQKIISLKPKVILNAAAYTDVDSAENNRLEAQAINDELLSGLSLLSNEYGIHLIHLSTDYVFNPKNRSPIKINAPKSPINYYGLTKLAGEMKVTSLCDNYTIIRVSRVYSEFGKNFIKTMINLLLTKDSIDVVSDEVSCLTNANDLSDFIFRIINDASLFAPTIYHFCNKGENSWYDIAKELKRLLSIKFPNSNIGSVNPIKSSLFQTVASRPKFSALDVSVAERAYGSIKTWEESLNEFLRINYE